MSVGHKQMNCLLNEHNGRHTCSSHAGTLGYVTDCTALHAAYRDLFDAIDGVTLEQYSTNDVVDTV